MIAAAASSVATGAAEAAVPARAGFLAGREPFVGLSREDLARVAASVVERVVPPGEVVLVQPQPKANVRSNTAVAQNLPDANPRKQ